jgi:predicted DNA-binding transcriptional regulator YafY
MEQPVKPDRVSTYEGVARVIYAMARGRHLTTQEVADMTGRTRQTAYRFLAALEASHFVPVYFDCECGTWSMMEREEKP